MSFRYFKVEEFACRCGCGRNGIRSDFVSWLDGVRHELGAPMIVTSGYRCPEHNARVSTTGAEGPHTTGYAADFAASGAMALRIAEIALRHGVRGLGLNQRGAHGSRFVHLDRITAGRPTVWTY